MYVYQLILAKWLHMASMNLLNIGSGNGLLSDGTNPLPEPMLTNHFSMTACGIHLKVISQEMLHIFILGMSLTIAISIS